ncbi:MAG TPA: 3-methyl-2-oxobutanoate hydroxymethyltransferase [Anaerolineae bacterium]|nr:3-methyl-2-oxobutanoate hydroxymethyltransferase [Anaerolineae bacterium]
MPKKINILSLHRKKAKNSPISMVTAYDYSSSLLVSRAEIDMILVGDSLGMVMLGLDGTVPVTMDEMLHHCRAVARGAGQAPQTPFLVGDMPFLSYQVSIPEAIRNAGRFLKESGMDAVKLEGGQEMADTIRAITNAGIPVMGHLGLTPQSVSKLGGYRVQGKTATAAHQLYQDALALQQAGCFSLVFEAVPAPIATAISQRLDIFTIGIGAGAGCDGQVLVYHDLLGFLPDHHQARFVKQYAQIGAQIEAALTTFRQEVDDEQFPAEEHTYPMDQDELNDFLAQIDA